MLLVTGGAGFIGSNLVAALNDAGRADVTVCDVLGHDGKWRNLAKRQLADIVPPAELMCWLDGRRLKELPIPQERIIKGDCKSLTIAAASILAKTARDARMRELDERHPGYGFAKHKGYPVPEHLAALKALGVQIEDVNEEEGEIEGVVPIDKIGAIKKLDCVAYVRTVFRYEDEEDDAGSDDDGGFQQL